MFLNTPSAITSVFDPSKCQSFQDLQEACQNGNLEFRYLFAPHGSGSTAFLMWLRNYFDIVINEPECQFLTKENVQNPFVKADGIYDYIASVYHEHKEKHADGKPIRMAVKFIVHSLPLSHTYAELTKLNCDPLWLIRHPALSVASKLRTTIKLLLTNQECDDFDLPQEDRKLLQTMQDNGNYADLPPQYWFTHRYFLERFDISHRVDKQERNSHGDLDGFPAFAANHPQLARFMGFAEPKESVDRRMVRATYPEFTRIYKEMGNFYNYLRVAYSEKACNPHIIDFECFQFSPELYADAFVKKIWGIDKKRDNLGVFINAYDHFYPERPGFSEIMFGDALQNDASILPPRTNPSPPNRFPPFIRGSLGTMTNMYYDGLTLSKLPFPSLPQLQERNERLSESFSLTASIFDRDARDKVLKHRLGILLKAFRQASTRPYIRSLPFSPQRVMDTLFAIDY